MREILIVIGLAIWVMPSIALAEKKVEPVSVQMEAYKIIVENKIEHQRPAEKAHPNDVIEYIATYKNNTDHGITHLMATLPIPQGMEYMVGTALPKGAKASVDGAVYAAIPLTRRVQLPSGKWETKQVPYNEYRSLRWDLETLKAGKNKAVKARMRVAPLKTSTTAKEG